LVDRRHIRGAAENREARRLNMSAIEGPIGLSLRHRGRRRSSIVAIAVGDRFLANTVALRCPRLWTPLRADEAGRQRAITSISSQHPIAPGIGWRLRY
jgi:hypothetical protein